MTMSTKLDKGVTYYEGVPCIKSHDAWIMWLCRITWQTKTIIFSLPQCLWLQNWQDGDLTWPASTHKVTWPYNPGFLQDHVTNYNHYISTATMPVAARLGRVGMHSEEFTFYNLITITYNFITWSQSLYNLITITW